MASQRIIQGHIVHNSLDILKKKGITGASGMGKQKVALCHSGA